jgi:hypothetical protein
MITLHHVYPTVRQGGVKPPGLGDYLRGSIALAWHARRLGYRLHLELSEHPIGRLLDPAALTMPATSGDFIEFSAGGATGLYEWLETLTPASPTRLHTDLLPHASRIDPEVCQTVLSQLRFVPEVSARAADLHRKVSSADFAALHVRMSDDDFRTQRGPADPLLRYIESRIVPAWGRRVAVLSNNDNVKRLLCDRFGFPLLESSTVHLGESQADDIGVRDTLVDFTLMGRAAKVYSHSFYNWKSGFSHWCATLHGVEFEQIELTPTKPAPGLRRLVRRTLDAWAP